MTDTASEVTASDIAENIESVRSRIKQASIKCNRDENAVRLVAVSKTKPSSMILDAYNVGQRRFGENYAQELISKASTLPSDISWHFIGPLQSNKAAPLVKNVGTKLKVVETVSTMKLATKLNNAARDAGFSEDEQLLGVYLQVNTSGEESKSGLKPGGEVLDLAREIRDNCTYLKVTGLMTIGAPGETKDFDVLRECRTMVAEGLGLDDENELDLSMGMSGDFEAAIEKGATSVRVGSTIFGARDYSNLK